MYAPQHRPGLEIDLLIEEELVLVTTDLKTYHANDPRYVHVEWGTGFSLHHAVSFPDTTPSFVANLVRWRSVMFYRRVVLVTSECMRFSLIWH